MNIFWRKGLSAPSWKSPGTDCKVQLMKEEWITLWAGSSLAVHRLNNIVLSLGPHGRPWQVSCGWWRNHLAGGGTKAPALELCMETSPRWCPFTSPFSKEQPVFKCVSFCASNAPQERVTFQTNNPFLLRCPVARGSSELPWGMTVLGLFPGLSATHTHGKNENETPDTNLSHEWGELISIFTQFELTFSWQLLQLHAQQGWMVGKRWVLREQRQVIQRSSHPWKNRESTGCSQFESSCPRPAN